MKRKIFGITLIVFTVMLLLLLASCGKDRTSIQTEGFLSEGGIYRIDVPNSTKTFDLMSKIKLEKKAKAHFSTNKDFSDEIKDGKVNLKDGNNIVYLKVTDKRKHESIYTFNIYRKRMLTVTFDPNGGIMTNTTMVVQEGTGISQPTATKVGHSLSWDYDFKKPITQNITIKAIWTPRDCKITATVNGETTVHYVDYGSVPSGLPSLDIVGYRKTTTTGWTYNGVSFDPTAPFSYNVEEIEIVANLEPIVYDVVYDVDENVTNANEANGTFSVVNLDQFFLFIPTHASSNYQFLGWSLDKNSSEVISKISPEHISNLEGTALKLYPVWKINSSVEYDCNGGECSSSTDSFEYGKEYELPIPTLEQHSFDGWYYDGNRVENVGVWSLKEDVVLTAKWTRYESDINYVLNSDAATNNENNPDTFNISDEAFELLIPTNTLSNYRFVGWYTHPSLKDEYLVTHITSEMVVDVVTLYAKWEVTTNVTFNPNGGVCEVSSGILNKNVSSTLPIPTKDKYKFEGWYYNGELISDDTVWTYDVVDAELIAHWSAIEYKINYELNGGTIEEGKNPDKFTVETDPSTIVFFDPTREYCVFDGWYYDAEFENPVTSFDPAVYDSSVTIYAKWIVTDVVFNYDVAGGSIESPKMTIALGDNYIHLVPSKSGFKFLGWFVNGEKVEDSGRWTDENKLTVDLVAHWEIIEYTITYDLNGGSYSGTFVYKYTVETSDIVLLRPTRGGYEFAGWSLNGGYANFDVVINTGCIGDRSYKALWAAKKDANGVLYSMINDKLVVVGMDRVLKESNDNITEGVRIPARIEGVDVVAIESNAFKAFGEKFSKSKYANMSNSYVTFYIPSTIKRIGAGAFENLNGVKVTLYDADQPNKPADYKTWDKTTIWEVGNESARDCIWGFRPAIGWTRYSKVEIPEGYEPRK